LSGRTAHPGSVHPVQGQWPAGARDITRRYNVSHSNSLPADSVRAEQIISEQENTRQMPPAALSVTTLARCADIQP
jgi:hypothetical protein